MSLPKRQYTVSLLFPTPQMANMGKLKKENCVGVYNTELVTDSQRHVAMEAHRTVILMLDPLWQDQQIETKFQSQKESGEN